MSEIEKLYQNAGVEKEVIPCPAKYYGYDCTRNNWDDSDCSCDIEGYPPFTAEKQLKLLQYIEKLDWIDAIVSFYYMEEFWVFLAQPIREFANEQYRDFGGKQKEYEQAIAQMINTLWQNLTDTEKAEIKRILE